MKNNFLLLSSSRTHDTAFLEHASMWLKESLAGVDEILFVPYAGVTKGWDDYTQLVSDAFEKMNIKIKGVHSVADAQEALKQAQAIAVGGGNTFQLLNELYKQDLLSAIRARVNNGMSYVGWSAGSNVACPTICTSNDMPIIEPPSFTALGLVPFQINPHYIESLPAGHMGETREQRLQEFLTANPACSVLALPEGSALQCTNGELQLRGKPAYFFQSDGSKTMATEAMLVE